MTFMKEVVLLAEDEEADAVRMRRIFDKLQLPYELRIVGDGQEAIDYLDGQGQFADRSRYPLPALVILDIRMPRKSGEDVLDWLRTSAHLPPTFVVALTGASQTAAVPNTFERHGAVTIFNCHFLKPATADNISMIMTFFESCRTKSPAGSG